MANVSNNGMITLNRGDTFQYPIYINVNTKTDPVWYTLDENDIIYISVCEANQGFEEGVIRKQINSIDFDPDGRAWFKLTSDDTKNLLLGTYYYEIKIKIGANDNIGTIVPKRKFLLID